MGSWDRTRQTELFIEELMNARSSCVIPDGVEDSIRKWIQSRRSWRLMIPRGRFLARLELFLCSFIPYVLFKFTNSWMFYLLKYFSLIFATLLRDMFTVYQNVKWFSFNDSKSSFSFCLHPVSKRDGCWARPYHHWEAIIKSGLPVLRMLKPCMTNFSKRNLWAGKHMHELAVHERAQQRLRERSITQHSSGRYAPCPGWKSFRFGALDCTPLSFHAKFWF